MRYAVVDLGSNTLRMAIYEQETRGFRHILSEKEVVGLIGYTQGGVLSEEGICRIVSTMQSFRETADAVGTDHFGCFATAGLRAVKNADEVCSRARYEAGVDIRIISGEEEARLDFLGAFRPAGVTKGLVTDMGGGSTEIVRFKKDSIENSISLNFGSLNLYKRFVRRIVPTRGERRDIRDFVKKEISLVDWLPDSGTHICLIGGTARAIVRLHRELYLRGQEPLQGYSFPAGDIREIYHKIIDLGDEGIRFVVRETPERIHTILPGLIAFSQLVKTAGCETVSLSRSGVREGFLTEFVRNIREDGACANGTRENIARENEKR